MTPPDKQPDTERGSLSALGVRPQEERLYRHLLRTGPVSAAEAAEVTGLSGPEVAELAEALVRDGLLAPTGATPASWVAVPPQAVIEGLMQRRERELSEARRALLSMVAEQQTFVPRIARGGPVELLEGPVALARRHAELEASVEREMLVLSKAPFVRRTEGTEEVLGVLRRQVRCRSVYDRSALERPGSLRMINEFQAAGELVRVADQLPMKMLIADRRTALVPVGAHRPDLWLSVQQSDLLDGLVSLFELIWSRSVPAVAGAKYDGMDDPLPQEDVEFLALLFGGLTDAAIARQMATSVRTVQRRVTRLMLRADVQSRAQLAWQAARRGWLAEGQGQ